MPTACWSYLIQICFLSGAERAPWFLLYVFFLGVASANFAVYTMWVPELYGTECQGSAFALSVRRFVAAAATFVVGACVSQFQTIGIPIALSSPVFLFGLRFLPFGEETKGKKLPA